MELSKIYSLFLTFPKICTDSRKAEKGSIFFALQGENFDANQYAKQALADGCEYAIVDKAEYAKTKRIILVENVLACLQALAQMHRRELGLQILAITGSNGKTTTKELVREVLSKKFRVIATVGNLNNHIGVPLTLLSMTKETEIGIVEMGANHIGEIGELCAIAEPDFGLITNVGKAHIEGFGSLEGVMQAKGQLYKWLYDNRGTCFVNVDNELLLSMLYPQSSFGYGTSDSAECSGKIVANNDGFLAAQIVVRNSDESAELIELKTKLVGNYNFDNLMAAASVGSYFGVKPSEIKKAIEDYRPSNNRSQIVTTTHNTVIKDAYNANPMSMKAAIDNFSESNFRTKVLILGEMRELGDTSAAEHEAIVNLIQASEWASVFLVGELFSGIQSGFLQFSTVQVLTDYLKKNPIRQATILVKGSRGVQLEKCYDLL